MVWSDTGRTTTVRRVRSVGSGLGGVRILIQGRRRRWPVRHVVSFTIICTKWRRRHPDLFVDRLFHGTKRVEWVDRVGQLTQRSTEEVRPTEIERAGTCEIVWGGGGQTGGGGTTPVHIGTWSDGIHVGGEGAHHHAGRIPGTRRGQRHVSGGHGFWYLLHSAGVSEVVFELSYVNYY